MLYAISLTLTVLTFLSLSSTQAQLQCKAGKASVIQHRDGVLVQTVSFSSDKVTEPVLAYIFIPDSHSPVPGIAFAHSGIHTFKGRTDLLPFARALARAGAASIVLDRTIQWEPLNDEANRAPSVMHCATQWMFAHVNLDTNRLATAGPNDWRGEEYCKPDVPTTCWTGHQHPLWLNYGETSNAELSNTKSMLTLEGQLYMARFAQRVLRLREVKREWLSEGDVMAGK